MKIQFLNSSSLSFDDFSRIKQACTIQLERDVMPFWKNQIGYCQIVDNSPDAIITFTDNIHVQSLGKHTYSNNGIVSGVVHVQSILSKGFKIMSGSLSVSCIASHEMIEICADPFANKWIRKNDGHFIAYEICDPVESDFYEIDNIALSNFVLPNWFCEYSKDIKFDFMGNISFPMKVSKTGRSIQCNPANGTIRHVHGSHHILRRNINGFKLI